MKIATIKGAVDSSINIIIDTMKQVGDTISFDNLASIIPDTDDYTRFFYECINFCKLNGSSRSFVVESVKCYGDKYELAVSPVRDADR